jgi:hypothetical protein
LRITKTLFACLTWPVFALLLVALPP